MSKTRNVRNPLYRQVYNSLSQKINSGEISKNDYLPSERELGLQFNVDRLTVRRALGLLCDDGLVEKHAGIGTFVKDLSQAGNSPVGNSQEFLQKNNESKNILIVLTGIESPNSAMNNIYNAASLLNIQKECRKYGYNSVCVQDMPDCTLSTLADGINFKGIIFSNTINANILKESVSLGIPSVIYDQVFDGITSIVLDNEAGVRQSVSHLAEKGHQRIAVITGTLGDYNADIRVASFKKTMKQLNLDLPGEYIVEGDWTYESGSLAAKKLISLPTPPTAIVAANDFIALGAIHAMQEAGLKVPEDISIVGFDDIDSSEFNMPALSTISANSHYAIRVACMHLFFRIESGCSDSCHVIVPTRLITRGSVAAPSKK